MCSECPANVIILARRLATYIRSKGDVIAGGLHIVIEDENVQDHHIKWCQETQELDPQSVSFAKELLSMTVPERHMAVQMAWDDHPPWS